MNICIPVTEDQGLNSPVSAHFGSAPLFMVVDTDSRANYTVANTNQHHNHGMCQPLAVLAGAAFDALVVGGIGMGALQRLQTAGIRVYLATTGTVEELLAAWASKSLKEATPAGACAGHQHHGGACH